MDREPLPFDAPLSEYERQAAELLDGQRAREPAALAAFHQFHPRFRTEGVPWLPRAMGDDELGRERFERDDARLAVARAYSFADWPALAEWVGEVSRGGEVYRFEAAVEAVVDGDLARLEALLREDPELVRARSTRRTCFDPPVHRATLLHYVAANGVEGHRQRTPRNAPAIARALLEAGAQADAPASLYGADCATMSLLVSSEHPARAGVQGELVEVLLDHGASIEGRGEMWGSPLMTALVFGCRDAADALVRRGARAETLAAAAGLGDAGAVERRLPESDAESRHLALALAAQLGRADVVRLLLDAGEDPDRYNPEGAHAHATPLHQAVYGGHVDVVGLLVARGARLDIRDRIYESTPLGWAEHCGQREIAELLRARSAQPEPARAAGGVVCGPLRYTVDGESFTGYLADGSGGRRAPGVLVAHEGPGLTAYIEERARQLAGLGYVAFALDLYGERDLPLERAKALVRELRADRAMLLRRTHAAQDLLEGHGSVDPRRCAAIGYCFGGTAVLELARDGRELRCAVGFHPGLDTSAPGRGRAIRCPLLVCLGSEDPIVVATQRDAFVAEMSEARVDYRLILYDGAGHSFTNRDIDALGIPGFAHDPAADRLSWAAMRELFARTLDPAPGAVERPQRGPQDPA